jgi:hypothetical protein
MEEKSFMPLKRAFPYLGMFSMDFFMDKCLLERWIFREKGIFV